MSAMLISRLNDVAWYHDAKTISHQCEMQVSCLVLGVFATQQTRRTFSRMDLSDFVPEGLYDRSQAIYCLEPVQSRIRPVGTV